MTRILISTDSISWSTATIQLISDGANSVSWISNAFSNSSVDGSAATLTSRAVKTNNDIILRNLFASQGDTFSTLYKPFGLFWTTQNVTLGTTPNSIGYGNGIWIIATPTGMATSTDTVVWEYPTIAERNFVTSAFAIAYNNGLWVAGGLNGELKTSTNTISWVTINSNFGTTLIRSIAYGNGMWVAGGYAGQLRASTDAITWVTRTIPTVSNIFNIAYGNGMWMLPNTTSGRANVLTSTDTITWTTRFISFRDSSGLSPARIAAYGNGIWIVAGGSMTDAGISRSTDAINWTTVSNSGFGYTMSSIAYGNGVFSLQGHNNGIRITTNGITWVTPTSPTFTDSADISIAYGNGAFLVGQSSGSFFAIKSSKNDVITPSPSTKIYTGNGSSILAIAPSRVNSISSTTDLISYTSTIFSQPVTSVTSNFGSTIINSVAYGNGIWVAVAYSSVPRAITRYSTNSVNWTTLTFTSAQIGFSDSGLAVAYGNGMWAMTAGQSGLTSRLLTSTNAINWITRPTSNFTNEVRVLVYNQGVWVAGGLNGQLRTSTDTITWVTRNSNFGTTTILFADYINNLWVASGNSGQLRTSTDAVTWITRNTNLGASPVQSVAYGNGTWILGSTSGIGQTFIRLMTSTDLVTWTTRIAQGSNGSSNPFIVTYTDNSFYAFGTVRVGGGGSHRSFSTDGISWQTGAVTPTAVADFVKAGDDYFTFVGNAGYIANATIKNIVPNNVILNSSGVADLVVGDSGRVAKNNSGTWSIIQTPINDKFINGAVKNNTYNIVGQNAIYNSTNLVNWTTITTLSASVVNDIIAK